MISPHDALELVESLKYYCFLGKHSVKWRNDVVDFFKSHSTFARHSRRGWRKRVRRWQLRCSYQSSRHRQVEDKEARKSFQTPNEFNEAQKKESKVRLKGRRKLSPYQHRSLRTIQLILLLCDWLVFLMGKINFHSHIARLTATKFAHPRSVPS